MSIKVVSHKALGPSRQLPTKLAVLMVFHWAGPNVSAHNVLSFLKLVTPLVELCIFMSIQHISCLAQQEKSRTLSMLIVGPIQSIIDVIGHCTFIIGEMSLKQTGGGPEI